MAAPFRADFHRPMDRGLISRIDEIDVGVKLLIPIHFERWYFLALPRLALD